MSAHLHLFVWSVALAGVLLPLSSCGRSSTPPTITLQANIQEQTGLLLSYCWQSDGGRQSCADKALHAPADPIQVMPGEPLRFVVSQGSRPISWHLEIYRPAREGETADEELLDRGGAVPLVHMRDVELLPRPEMSYRPGLGPGMYILILVGRWAQGNASFIFRVQFEEPFPREE